MRVAYIYYLSYIDLETFDVTRMPFPHNA